MLAVIGFVLWPSAEPTANATTVDADAARATAERAAATRSSATEPSAAPDRRTAPSPAESGDQTRDDNEGNRLRIEDEHGTPLPGAEYFEGQEPSSSMTGLLEGEAWREWWHPDAWLLRCTHQVANAAGYVTPHTTHVHHLYVSRHGGQLTFWGFPFPEELRAEPERTCKITVIDATAQPIVGAAVTLRREREPANSREPIVGVTDAHGVCIASHLQRLHPDAEDLGYLPRFGVRGLGLRSADVPFDPSSPPAAVTLTLPPCGRVAVELLDTNGARLTSPDLIMLLAPDGEELTEYARTTGPIEFGLCAVGLQLAVTTPENHRFAGPRTAGERIVESLRLIDLEAHGYVLTGRALRTNGTPLVNCVLYTKADLYSLDKKTTTTATGRFVFAYAADDRRHLLGEDGLGIVECAAHQYEGLVDHRGAFVHLTDPLQPGIVDLGDVVLRDSIVLARGRVRSAAGPLVGAHLQTDYYGGGQEPVLQPDGRFEVRSLPDFSRVMFEARAKGHATKEIVEDVPCPDLDIVLEPEGRCAAVVLVEPELLWRYDLVNFDLVDGAGVRHRDYVGASRDSWECLWDVPFGTYRCEVRLVDSPQPLAVVPGIVVAPWNAPADEPVQIDLRGRLRAVRLAWVDEAGESLWLRDPSVYATSVTIEADGVRTRDAVRGDNLGCWLLWAGAPITITAENGEFTGTWSGPRADTNVIMRPVPGVPCRIPELPPAPEGTSWWVLAVAEGGDASIQLDVRGRLGGRETHDVGAELEAAGRAALLLLPNSRYSIYLIFHPKEDSMRRSRRLRATSGDVDLGATLPNELVFRFDAQKMQAAMR